MSTLTINQSVSVVTQALSIALGAGVFKTFADTTNIDLALSTLRELVTEEPVEEEILETETVSEN